MAIDDGEFLNYPHILDHQTKRHKSYLNHTIFILSYVMYKFRTKNRIAKSGVEKNTKDQDSQIDKKSRE